jgi:hypothetical protein
MFSAVTFGFTSIITAAINRGLAISPGKLKASKVKLAPVVPPAMAHCVQANVSSLNTTSLGCTVY